MCNDYKVDFFMSQITTIRDIKENNKIKISLVYYEIIQGPCILKVCKNRNLTDVCKKLMDIRHPNVAVVYDYMFFHDDTYILEEFINGTTLRDIISEKGVFTEKETSRVIVDVCKGLEMLHFQNPPVVHNDINTGNVMIKEDGTVKIFDFDISRTYKTGSGQNTRLFGTEEYAAPEHFGYGQSEPRTDIYSLGVTMHEMLTGKQLTSEHKMTYKGKLKNVIKKCIEIDPKKRYASVKQIKHDLNRIKNKSARIIRNILTIIIILIFAWVALYNRDNDYQQENYLDSAQDDSQALAYEELSVIDADTEFDKTKATEPEKTVEQENIEEELIPTEDEEIQPLIDEDLVEEKINKVMKNVYTLEGELKTIIGKNDGTLVLLEVINEECYIRTSTGQNKKLEDIEGSYYELAYNGHSDKLYLIRDYGSDAVLYEIDDNLNVYKIGECEGNEVDLRNTINVHCDFFSDGMLLSNAFDYALIDSNTWTTVGNGPEVSAVIDDKMYLLKYDVSYDDPIYSSISEIDFQGNVVQKYELFEKPDNCWSNNMGYYSSKNAVYFIGTKDDKEYVYCFDGEKWENLICLNDYQYYSKTYSSSFAVTDNTMWLYDRNTKVIKEFKLN